MSKEGVPVSSLPKRERYSMLMSLPNSVGIEPARADEDVFKASGRLVYQLGRFSTNCNKVIFAETYQSVDCRTE